MKLGAAMILVFFFMLSAPQVKADDPPPLDQTTVAVLNDAVDPVLVVNEDGSRSDHGSGDILTQ